MSGKGFTLKIVVNVRLAAGVVSHFHELGAR